MENLPVKTIRQVVTIPAEPIEVYHAYLDTKKAEDFTGQKATGNPRVGEKMTQGDGYITGKYLDLVEGKTIVQEWTTTEWPKGYGPSILELTLKSKGDNETELTMVHSKVPESQVQMYSEGWQEYYWTPLRDYFSEKKDASRTGKM